MDSGWDGLGSFVLVCVRSITGDVLVLACIACSTVSFDFPRLFLFPFVVVDA